MVMTWAVVGAYREQFTALPEGGPIRSTARVGWQVVALNELIEATLASHQGGCLVDVTAG
jgi:hypothetical protein